LLNYFETFLRQEGYAVRTAFDGEEGLRLYSHCAPFNIVLIDYYIPKKSATELAAAIRQINPLQGMIIAAFDYRNDEDVPRPKDLMQVPLLMDLSNFQLRKLLDKLAVSQAIENLTAAELLRLQKFADWRIRGVGRAALGRTGEDLLGEALLSTLIGAERANEGRHWNQQIDFVTYLAGAMRSISTGWARKFDESEAYLASEVIAYDAQERERSPLDTVASSEPTADQYLLAREESDRILSRFEECPAATQVVRSMLQGKRKNHIMQECGLTENQYKAILRRIRMKLSSRENNGSSTGEGHGR
ncbi:MAG: response regulator, partial [Acidobacteriota bacterium]